MGVMEHTPPGYFMPGDDEPVLFMAGPIQGAPDWQIKGLEVVRNIWDLDRMLHVVNPRWMAKPEEFVKNDQITWEKKYLRRASILGGLVFYLAAECSDAPAPNKLGRAYAQTTRHEFGRAAGWKDNDPSVVISLGMEDGYIGNEDYYRHTAEEFGLPVHDNIEDTVAEAVENTKDRYRFILYG
jgi:hypothetical protein